ncbi:hypothetical protein HYH03_013924 [Edaphochlamys debaryana]|uniref:Uncharacterized protein n=1 Tax=Edaphochlamys debaryana TaxID=47281 RepID=A0A835XSN3_9CHLO|nr:hypothetical protein HYH03_013924 [Edaphochlamys debaryana]|eukprot:KAG2487506.1 hypothetical protein HYH03_013924 [Edaphochlamys debaryana]
MARVSWQDAWVFPSVLGMMLRLLAALLPLSPRVYGKVVAVLLYGTRATDTVFHVAMGPAFVPSRMALVSLFHLHWPYDILLFMSVLGVWDVNMVVELSYCAWVAMANCVLASWYQDHVPGGVSIPWQLASRLLVAAAEACLHLALCRPATQARRARAAAAATTPPAPFRPPRDEGKAACWKPSPSGGPGHAAAEGQPPTPRTQPPPAPIPGGATQPPADRPGARRPGEALAARAAEARTAAAWGSRVMPAPEAAAPEPRALARRPLPPAPASAGPAATAGPAWAAGSESGAEGGAGAEGGGGGALAPLSARPLYRSRIERRCSVLKILHAHPPHCPEAPRASLTRLEAALAACAGGGRGRVRLSVGSVERGCVEAALAAEALGAAGNEAPAQRQPPSLGPPLPLTPLPCPCCRCPRCRCSPPLTPAQLCAKLAAAAAAWPAADAGSLCEVLYDTAMWCSVRQEAERVRLAAAGLLEAVQADVRAYLWKLAPGQR